MTGGASAVFVDTNILVYANVVAAPFHTTALQALANLQSQGGELWISRQVLREYMATLTRPQTYTAPLSWATVAECVRYFQSHFQVAEDGPVVTENLLGLLRQIPLGGRQVHDANIVATMPAYRISIILTHNQSDFSRFHQFITILTL